MNEELLKTIIKNSNLKDKTIYNSEFFPDIVQCLYQVSRLSNCLSIIAEELEDRLELEQLEIDLSEKIALKLPTMKRYAKKSKKRLLLESN